MLQITDRKKENALHPLWRMPFRPLFLGGVVWSCVALLLWLLTLLGKGSADLRVSAAWHAHEMLFGFAGAIVVGFLATACQTWTGLRAPCGRILILLCSAWLLARLGYLIWAVPLWMPVIAEVAFFIAAAFMVGRRVLAVRQWRNLFVVPALLGFAGLAAWHGITQSRPLAILTLLLVASMILVIGGRVIPFFTSRRFNLQARPKILWLEYAGHGLCVALLVIFAASLLMPVPRFWLGALAVLLGLVQIARCARWRVREALREPMLWSLHLNYWLMVAGLLLLGAAWIGLLLPINTFLLESAAVHAIAVGGIGGIILSMITRVTLGHTGRSPLQPAPATTLAFILLLAATLARVLLAPAMVAYWLSTLLWLLGYGIFLWRYGPMLLSPRIDGQPG
ncbi:NnrS family protein [Microbulbifer epialgicus]|uniref:NnrS family protein n=1 Tax=Microbulbifer epialgicus TaxID=393907 RepID=A0ABV4P423_9GAMM